MQRRPTPGGTHRELPNDQGPKVIRGKVGLLELAKQRGADPDVLLWDLGNHKPHKYYW